MNIKEITDIVFDINNEIYDAIGETYPDYYLFELSVKTNGYSAIIEYLGFCIWSEDDDERKEIQEDIYEPLEVYLKRKIKEISSVANLINLN
ncbi:MAG: hypothetical protein WC055_00815 [Melioribacteraceae bacterium]